MALRELSIRSLRGARRAVELWGAIIPSDEANPDSNRSGSSFVALQGGVSCWRRRRGGSSPAI